MATNRKTISSKVAAISVAAAFALLAAPASAAVLDFESYAPGTTSIGGVTGSPYPFVWLSGTIENGGAFGDGNYVNVSLVGTAPERHGYIALRDFFTGTYVEGVGGKITYQPTLLSFDYYVSGPSTAQVHGQASVDLVVGSWETFTYNQVIDQESFQMRFNTSHLLLDNFRYVDGFAVVPEPSTWAFMITGFGLAGAGLRTDRRARRKLLPAC